MMAGVLLGQGRPLAAASFQVGDCELREDPATRAGFGDLNFNVCVRANEGVEANFVSSPQDNAWLSYGSAYGGVFIASWLSFQSRGWYRLVEPLGHDALVDKDVETDYAVMQLGDPVLSKVRLTAGRARLPFGVDLTDAPQFYQMRENRLLWLSPPDSAWLTLDDLKMVKVEAGVATNELKRKGKIVGPPPSGEVPPTENAASIRASVDLSALEGTRLVASGYGDKGGERRFGAGVINRNRKGDFTDFEFVRRLTTPDGHAAPFQQLLRIGYTSAWNGSGRFVAQFDDEQLRFRRGILDYDVRGLADHMIFRVGASYTKDESGAHANRWALITGLEADL
jgi:hypothetical protein